MVIGEDGSTIEAGFDHHGGGDGGGGGGEKGQEEEGGDTWDGTWYAQVFFCLYILYGTRTSSLFFSFFWEVSSMFIFILENFIINTTQQVKKINGPFFFLLGFLLLPCSVFSF